MLSILSCRLSPTNIANFIYFLSSCKKANSAHHRHSALLGSGELADLFPDAREGVAAVGSEMLGNAERREESRVVRQNFSGRLTAVKIAEQSGDGLDHEGIGIAMEEAFAVLKFGGEPQFSEAAGKQVLLDAEFGGERWTLLCPGHQEGEAILSVLNRGQFGNQLNLFFREVHGAFFFRGVKVGRVADCQVLRARRRLSGQARRARSDAPYPSP
jgi:hypothetical protein